MILWTTGQERQIICSSYLNNEFNILYNIPTVNGSVYCISACPIDTNQIAFGVGDSMIRLWNLSEPHKNTIDATLLWDSIKGRVRSVNNNYRFDIDRCIDNLFLNLVSLAKLIKVQI